MLVNEVIHDGSESLRAVALYDAVEIGLEPTAITTADDSPEREIDPSRPVIRSREFAIRTCLEANRLVGALDADTNKSASLLVARAKESVVPTIVGLVSESVEAEHIDFEVLEFESRNQIGVFRPEPSVITDAGPVCFKSSAKAQFVTT